MKKHLPSVILAVVLLLLIVIVTYAQKAVEKWLENRSSGVTK